MGLLDIIYRDDRLVAIDKPDGLLVHKARQSSDHVYALQLLRDQIGHFVHPIHRLDRATSGVLLFALDPDTARAVCEQFAGRAVEKRYLALVRGHPDASGAIDYPLREDPDHEPQEAVTDYRRLAAVEWPEPVGAFAQARYAWLELSPRTGRMHQLRRHCRHLSHPIVGDTTYGDSRHNRFFRERFQCYRLLLHAAELRLVHPATGAPLTLRAPVPPELVAVCARLGIDCACGTLTNR